MVSAKVSREAKLNSDHPSATLTSALSSRERAVVSSALWAAAGDALGWMTELSRDTSGVLHRTGSAKVSQPVDWQRSIGGRGGPRVDLPAGTYSDDTQLRLAVSRAIRGNGEFDAEAFAKIELTVWPTYALGAGLGTKAAAANLSLRSVNWFSNFFDRDGQKYISGGGNGAAMRIQPHVWAASADVNAMLSNVLKDALVTHGHAHGFCGAIFHALCVAHSLESRKPPSPSDWVGFIDGLSCVPELIASDPQLAAFWQSAWENGSGRSLVSAIQTMQTEAREDLEMVEQALGRDPVDAYPKVLERLGCLSAKFRGSGFKTALAASALAFLFRDRPIEEALIVAANILDSDTDTIATMAGAVLGGARSVNPAWPIQDREYIVWEAKRLAAISDGRQQDSFTYPDLGHWTPPVRQTASIGLSGEGLALAGLGKLEVLGSEYVAGDAVWQWFALPFGQTVLAKRKTVVKEKVSASQLPGERKAAISPKEGGASAINQQSLPLSESRRDEKKMKDISDDLLRKNGDRLDYWTDVVIQNDFDDLTLGRVFNLLLEEARSVDSAVAFAAIVAKAKLARERRRRG